MSPVGEGLPGSEPDNTYSEVEVVLHHNLIFRIIYNEIMVYRAAEVAEGLKWGLGYLK